MPVLVPAGQNPRLDFVDVQLGQLNGRVFEDVNRDGRNSPGEPGLAGVTVYLDLDRDGRLDAGEPATATIPGGYYSLSGLPDGSYSVGVLSDADWKATAGGYGFVEVTIAGGAAAQADFGRVRRLIRPIPVQQASTGVLLSVPVELTGAAAGRRLVFSLDGPVLAGAAIDPATGLFTWVPGANLPAGRYPFTVRVRDPFEPTFTEVETFSVEVTAPVVPPTYTPLIAVGGGSGVIRAFSAAGAPRLTLTPFAGFAGQVRVATGDVTGDGVADVVAAAGPGGPHVKVFDGATEAEVASFFAFEPGFTGGVFVAAGDLDGDGRADVAAGAGEGGGPRVSAFEWAVPSGGAPSRTIDFFAGTADYRGGVRVAVKDLDGDADAELVVGPGPGNGSRVTAFAGKRLGTETPPELFSIDPFPEFTGGVFVG